MILLVYKTYIINNTNSDIRVAMAAPMKEKEGIKRKFKIKFTPSAVMEIIVIAFLSSLAIKISAINISRNIRGRAHEIKINALDPLMKS